MSGCFDQWASAPPKLSTSARPCFSNFSIPLVIVWTTSNPSVEDSACKPHLQQTPIDRLMAT